VIGTLDEDLLRPPVVLGHRVHEPLAAAAVGVKQLRSNLNPLQHRWLNTDKDAKGHKTRVQQLLGWPTVAYHSVVVQ